MRMFHSREKLIKRLRFDFGSYGPDHEKADVIMESTRARVKDRLGIEVGFRRDEFQKALSGLSLEELASIVEAVSWVKAEVGSGPRGQAGVWVETEAENFACTRCGKCCFLPDAFVATADPVDVERWEKEGRDDILRRLLDCGFGVYDLWMDPRTKDEVHSKCPWYRKDKKTGLCSCKIHETKPRHCHSFPLTKRHALVCGCPGWLKTDLVPPEL